MRRTISVLVVVGLAVAVALLLMNRGGDTPPDTVAEGTTTTTVVVTTTAPRATTTTPGVTTTNPTEVQVVETIEEAEALLRELWFGWFEGIYNEDEERIREVVVLEETVDTARESFGEVFLTQPDRGHIAFRSTRILRSDEGCLVVETEMVLTDFREGASTSVHVIRFVDDAWRRLSLWRNVEDMWDQDCDSQLPSS